MISGFYTCATWNLCRRYGCTLHSRNLAFTTFVQLDFRVLHLHNLKSIFLVKWHFHDTLSHPNFHYIRKTWFPWLFHSCCGCFLHVHTYFVLNFMSRLSRSLFMFRRRISVQCNAVENSFFCSLVCPGSSCCVATVSSIQIYGNVWNCWQGISFLC